MNCRYCGGVYGVTERTCAGCGSPKTMRETLLDVPSGPGHWSHSMMDTVQRVLMISGAIYLGTVLGGMIGLGIIGAVVSFFWTIPCALLALILGAWKSSENEPGERFRNLAVAGLLWFGLIIAMFLAIGVAL